MRASAPTREQLLRLRNILLGVVVVCLGLALQVRASDSPTEETPPTRLVTHSSYLSRPIALEVLTATPSPSVSAIEDANAVQAREAESHSAELRVAEERQAAEERLLLEKRERDLEATRAEERRITQERNRAQQEWQAKAVSSHDLLVPLGTFQSITVGREVHRIAIFDDSPSEIRIEVGGARRQVRLKKHHGFGDSALETVIFDEDHKAQLSYVNEISERVGYCKLRVKEGAELPSEPIEVLDSMGEPISLTMRPAAPAALSPNSSPTVPTPSR